MAFGSDVHSVQDTTLSAENIIITNVFDIDAKNSKVSASKKSWNKEKGTEQAQGHYKEIHQASLFSTAEGDLTLTATNGGILLAASELQAGKHLNINILKETAATSSEAKQQSDPENPQINGLIITSAVGKDANWNYAANFSKSSLLTKKQKLKYESKEKQEINKTQYGSKLQAGGDIKINSQDDVWIQASDIEATRNITIQSEGNINIVPDYEEKQIYEASAQGKMEKSRASFNTKNNNFKYTLEAAFLTQKETKTTHLLTQKSAQLLAGKDIRIHSKKDITIAASAIVARQDINLHSEGDLRVISQNDIAHMTHNSDSTRTSLSLNIGNTIIEGLRSAWDSAAQISNNKKQRQVEATTFKKKETKAEAKRVKNPYADWQKVAQVLNLLTTSGRLARTLDTEIAKLKGDLDRFREYYAYFWFLWQYNFRTN